MCAFVLLTTQAASEETTAFESHILPLVTQYCTDCHNGDNAKGDLDIERFETQAMVVESVGLWRRMAMRLENKEMPPKKSPQPTDEERALMLKWVSEIPEDTINCNQIANEESQSWYPGYVMSRRLNRWEYENSLRDLFMADIKVAHLFPADGAGGEGFDNNGSALFLSAIQIEKYLDAAEVAINTAFASPDTSASARWLDRQPKVHTVEAEGLHPLDALDPVIVSLREAALDAARAALNDFAVRAWRRPVEYTEIDRLLAMFARAYDRGDSYNESLKLAFAAALVSPNFLFLAEPEPPQKGQYPLEGYPLASRLSYFIWASLPDDELMQLAEQGRLQDEGVLRDQVKRMLADPRSKALGDIFGLQWLGIAQLGETVRPDENRFPEYTDQLRDDMREEASVFLTRLMQEDRSLLELIDSDYTYANERLAAIYGLQGVTGDELQRVPLAGNARGGVLGMAAVLTATSHPLRTSPVNRGKWVLEQLLGDRVPPPPPNAGTLPEDDQQTDGLSLRARMEVHRKNPDCAACHNRMDPLGFGLENFDPIGRWRAEQAGQPVDATGELPSGEKFNGPEELRQVLLARKDEFARNLTRKLLGYALGRPLTRYDDCVITDCMEALQQNDYRPSVLFETIALSHPFRHRYSGGEVQLAEANHEQ
ncbi:MAG: hypothetical protein AMXMBFR84_28400 [Candidatus Hydrogenedentota bacterium]